LDGLVLADHAMLQVGFETLGFPSSLVRIQSLAGASHYPYSHLVTCDAEARLKA
jgi:hypothetical protein